MQNNCDGAGPHTEGQVRVLPMPGTSGNHGNLILCLSCWRREIAWRAGRNRELAADAQYPLPAWYDAAVYRT